MPMNDELDADWAEETIGSGNDDTLPSRDCQMLPTVGLGGSAGSLPALQAFLCSLPPDPGMAFIVVMHFSLQERGEPLETLLQACTRVPVVHAAERRQVEVNHVYVISPGHALRMADQRITLDELPHKRGRHGRPVLRLAASAHSGLPVNAAPVRLELGSGDRCEVTMRVARSPTARPAAC